MRRFGRNYGKGTLARAGKSVADLIGSEGPNYRSNRDKPNRDKINYDQIMTCRSPAPLDGRTNDAAMRPGVHSLAMAR